MTLAEFLRSLSVTRDRSWRITSRGEIRCYHDGRYYCPLTEVAFNTLSENLYEFEVVKAGKLLGLSLIDSGHIVGAADNSPPYRNIRMMIKRTLELT